MARNTNPQTPAAHTNPLFQQIGRGGVTPHSAGGGSASSLGAQAFTAGAPIHVAPAGAGHLPHEAWHVVQQSAGRSALPASHTLQSKGLSSQGAQEVAGGAVPSSSADRATLRGMSSGNSA